MGDKLPVTSERMEPAKVLPFVQRRKPEPKKPTLLDQLEHQLFNDDDP